MGSGSKTKGAGFEREIVRTLEEHGIPARKVPLSGAVAAFPDDVTIFPDDPDIALQVECKRRRKLPAYLVEWAECGIVAMREDRGSTLWVLDNETMIALLRAWQQQEEI